MYRFAPDQFLTSRGFFPGGFGSNAVVQAPGLKYQNG